MLKILQFTIADSRGGQTQYILNLWKQVDKRKIRFDFVTFCKDIECFKELEHEGCQVHFLSCYPEDNKTLFCMEFSKVLDYGYDIIEIHTSSWKDTIVEEMARKRGIKVIIHAHSAGIAKFSKNVTKEQAEEKHIERKSRISADMADAFWTCSREAGKWLFEPQILASKIEIIHNAIDTTRFSYSIEKRNEMRKLLEVENKFVLLHIGRLEWVKNQEFLIEMLFYLKKEYPQLLLFIVGNGNLKNELEKNTEKFNVKEMVRITGYKKDTENYYQMADVFLLPSISEAFPLTLLEAQCSGLPCICSTNVTEDINLTGNVKYISLNDRHAWEEEVGKLIKGYDRIDQSHILKEKGYDVKEYAKLIEEKYYAL